MTYVQEKIGTDGKKLVDMLWAIAQDKTTKDADRLRAIEILLDRGWNKPTQGVHLTEEMRPLVIDKVTAADVDASRSGTE